MRQRGFTLFDTATVALLLGVALLIALPRWHVRSMLARESEVLGDLADLANRLGAHQKSGARDLDHDGRGEYAPLGDILGARRDQATAISPGVYEMSGYLFAVMVPGARKTPVLAGSEVEVTDYAEVAWMIVAWPAKVGVTGMRAYAVTSYGVLMHDVDGYPYDETPPTIDMPLVEVGSGGVRRIAAGSKIKDWTPPPRTLDGKTEPTEKRGQRK